MPTDINNALTRMMQKQPVDRFAEMSEVAAVLTEFAAGADLTRLPERQTPALGSSASGSRDLQSAVASRGASNDSHRGWRRFGLIVLLRMLGGAVWFGLTSRKVDIGHGTMEVEFDDDAFEGTVTDETLTLKSLETGKSQTLKLTARRTSAPMAPGTYEIVVATDSGLEILGGPKVTIKSGDTQNVVARYVPKTASPDAYRRAAERVLKHRGSTVTVRLPDEEPIEIANITELPTEPFELSGLYAVGIEFTNDDAKLLNGLTSLQRLIFYQTSIDDDALSTFTQFLNCTYVALADCRVTSAGVIPLLEAMPKMTHLNVDATSVGADLIPEAAKCASLEWLGLPAHIRPSALAPLNELPRPIYLRYYAPITDDDLKLFVDLPLSFAYINAANISGVGSSDLRESRTLTGLGLKDGAGVTAQSIRNLKAWSTLEFLEFHNCALDRERLAAVSEIQQLQSLQITTGSLTVDDLVQLQGLPRLGTLYLYDVGLNASDFAALRKQLPRCRVTGT